MNEQAATLDEEDEWVKVDAKIEEEKPAPSPDAKQREEVHKKHVDTIVQFIKDFGYPVEVHKTETKDGFVLQMFRIPHGSDKSLKLFDNEQLSEEELEIRRKKKRPVVFLQHGCFNSSSTWVVCGPKQGLAFILADAGFDVWMGNNRGTQFSRTHAKLDEKHPDFWKFSWHEMGVYDFPAMIQYVIHYTQVSSLSYVGHSQGTTQAFVALSTHPELQKYVNLFIGLAPVASLKNQTSNSLKMLSKVPSDSLFSLLSKVGLSSGEIAGVNLSRSVLPQIAKYVTQNSLWNIVMDCNCDPAVLATIIAHEPSPTSLHNMSHWNQNIRSGFRPFDYGEAMNMQIYGAKEPPEYDLKKIDKTPIALFYGQLDYLSNPKDVEQFLLPRLKTKIFALYVSGAKHNDFVWGKESTTTIIPFVLQFIAQYNVNTFPENQITSPDQ
jgi:pimeloyl-ACP methyl ester carboxylesterase